MKTIKLTAVQSSLREDSYVSPEVTVGVIWNEGVLCMSGITTENEEWTNKTLDW